MGDRQIAPSAAGKACIVPIVGAYPELQTDGSADAKTRLTSKLFKVNMSGTFGPKPGNRSILAETQIAVRFLTLCLQDIRHIRMRIFNHQ